MKSLIVVLALAGVAYMLWSCWPASDQLRYRVTVEVQTPSGLMHGSAVLENRNVSGASGSLAPYQVGRAEAYGEAVTVDLGDGRQIFAVRENPYVMQRIYSMVVNMLAYPPGELTPPLPSRPSRGNWTAAYPEARRLKSSAVIRRQDYPMLVTFRDRMDPTSVVEVDPADAAATLGPGHSVRRITVTVTDDPITDGVVAKSLPWLPGFDRPVLVPIAGLIDRRPKALSLRPHAFRYMADIPYTPSKSKQ